MSVWPRSALQRCFKCEASGIKLGYNCCVSTTMDSCHHELGSWSDIAGNGLGFEPGQLHNTILDEYKPDIFHAHWVPVRLDLNSSISLSFHRSAHTQQAQHLSKQRSTLKTPWTWSSKSSSCPFWPWLLGMPLPVRKDRSSATLSVQLGIGRHANSNFPYRRVPSRGGQLQWLHKWRRQCRLRKRGRGVHSGWRGRRVQSVRLML